MEGQEHSVAAVAWEALAVENMLIRRGNPDMAGPRPQDYRNAERQIDALAAKGITLAGPDQRVVSGEAVTELIEFIDEHDPDDDRMTRSIWDALAELRAAFGAGPDASETGGQQ